MASSDDTPSSSNAAARLADLRLLRAAVEATSEAILITSPDLDAPGPRIEYANPAFTRLTGYAAEEVVGRSPRLLQGPLTDRSVLDRARAELIAGRSFAGQAVNYRKDGTSYMVEWLITPVRDEDDAITHWVAAQRDVTARDQAEGTQRLLVRELHHRVKNTLATVQAVMNATIRSATSLGEFQDAFVGRVASLAKTHALITNDQRQAVLLRDLLEAELAPYKENPQRVTLEGPSVVLPSELAVPIGMAVHELTTNALKHGALAHEDGRLEIVWEAEITQGRRVLHWTWNEHDGPPTPLPTREGFGSRLLKRVLTDQIQAEVDLAFDADGLRVTIVLPLPDGVQ